MRSTAIQLSAQFLEWMGLTGEEHTTRASVPPHALPSAECGEVEAIVPRPSPGI